MSLIAIKSKLQKNKYGKIAIKIYHYCLAIPMSKIYQLKYNFSSKNYKQIKYYEDLDVFEMLISQKKSLCRFGDGEISWIYKDSKGYFGQENSEELSEELKKVLLSNNDQIIIGIPRFFDEMVGYAEERKKSRDVHLAKYGKKWMALLDEKTIYADALITRVYMGRNDIDHGVYFKLWKQLWNDEDVIVIEGSETRFGVGNDLLDNAKTIRRILGPSENAFSKYQEIYSIAKATNKNSIILIALGPTATVLSYYLALDGFQAIDIGHLDIEYEWYKSKAVHKQPVKGKYVNEAGGSSNESIEDIDEKKYSSQIIYRC